MEHYITLELCKEYCVKVKLIINLVPTALQSMEHALKEIQGLWMVLLHKKEEWKCVSMVCGGVFAALAGTPLMPMLYADSLVFLDPVSQPCFLSPSVR